MSKNNENEMFQTVTFKLKTANDAEIRDILSKVYQALKDKGYDPVNQLSGYILTGDESYITNHNQARSLIAKVDRNELLNILIRCYLSVE